MSCEYYKLISLENEVSNLLEKKQNPKTIAKYISYKITKDCSSKYVSDLEYMLKLDCPLKENHGLTNLLIKMHNENFSVEKDNDEEPLIVPMPNFDMSFKYQQNLNHFDKSSIKFLYNSLLPFNYTNSDILLDLYVDETFVINHDVYKLMKIIPYTKNWYGFIHHTFDAVCKDNCNFLFINQDFINSLKYCKGLIVFSQHMKESIEFVFNKRQIKTKVFFVYHPIYEPVEKFKIQEFLHNKKVINIGSILSDTYSFYKLKFIFNSGFNLFGPYFCKSEQLKKYILNPISENIPHTKLLNDISKLINHRECSETNRWDVDMVNDILLTVNSVNKISSQDDVYYNDLLSSSVIFLNIINGSAIVILNECIIRNTPIIINKHPSVVQILGNNYPLYYSREEEFILTYSKIKKAQKYLMKLNKGKLKGKFNINTFIGSLNKIIDESLEN